MKRRSKAAGKTAKAVARKAATPTRSIFSKAVPRQESVVARLTRERDEALEREKASVEVLWLISQSPREPKLVFEAILENAVRLCEAKFGMLFLYNEKEREFRATATWNLPPAYTERLGKNSIRYHPRIPMGRAAITKQPVHITDVRADSTYIDGFPGMVGVADLGGARTLVQVPMLKENNLVGTIGIYRQEVRPFTDKQIELVQNFAAQAVIAIENARLLSELRQRTDDLSESLEQQTATAEVLKIISGSPGDLQPVFDAMLGNAVRICEANFGQMFLIEGSSFRMIAHLGLPSALVEYDRALGTFKPAPGGALEIVLQTKQAVQISDISAMNPEHPLAKLGGARSYFAVPMLKEGELIGAIVIYRQEVRAFTDKQTELVTNFAAQAVIAIENTRLLNELRQRTDDLSEALEQQTATSEVLKVISGSPGDLSPVFQAMLENAVRVCEAKFGVLFRYNGSAFRAVAALGVPPGYAEFLRESEYRPNVDQSLAGTPLHRLLQTKEIVQSDDEMAEPNPGPAAKYGGARSLIVVPMLKENELAGAFVLYRTELRAFTDKQIELVQNFAAQAVIAIENTRLLSELRQRTDDLSESLAQQTATSEVLRVISSKPGDLEPVFKAILENATRICGANFGIFWLREGDYSRAVALHDVPPDLAADRSRDALVKWDPARGMGLALATKQVVHIEDLTQDSAYLSGSARAVSLVELGGARTVLFAPLLKDNEAIGALTIYRQEVRPFTEKQIELVQNFAAQAVIAIENTRLLSELRESLQQQTATADVLKVISSSPGDLEPVFEAMLENAVHICDASFGNLLLYDGELFRHVALHNAPPAWAAERERDPIPPRDTAKVLYRVADTKQVAHVADMAAENPDEPITAIAGARTVLIMPMLKEHELVGAIAIYRQNVRPFSDKQVELVRNFAAQAVIAIENTRLLNELRESLAQQTATAEVLRIISSSPGDLERVFQAMLESAVRICDAKFGNIYRWDDESLHLIASRNTPSKFAEFRKNSPFRPGRNTPTGRMVATKAVTHVADLAADPGYAERDPQFVAGVELGGIRTLLSVPMLKDDELIGAFSIYRDEVRPFADKQIELVQNFAAQAVIAIENARLLSELRQSLQQQTATADVLKTISQSTFDLQTVLNTLTESAVRLCAAERANIWRPEGEVFKVAANFGLTPEHEQALRLQLIHPGRDTITGRTLLEGKTVHIPDAMADPDYNSPNLKFGVNRTVLGVPLMREGDAIGVLVVTRSIVKPFTSGEIALIETFADQASIAIENVRLFEAEQQRTRELANSLEDLQTAQDRLVQTQKLASLGQLTAGIAHEIKNPLNFVNNFSALSGEMLDELQQTLRDAPLNDKTRAEVDDLTETLRANLDKIEQHGKRADSIVKNMLLHSREGSGEHRPIDINSVVEESLNLAYHGARAEKQDFNITLERSFDPAAGAVDVFPQDITRVLLNLIANGFYAVTKRKAQADSDTYEPVLAASTRNLGDRVEIRIRDNGTGIPPEVKEKMFNPFFTTKPPGEGTGLGLSLSYDIIVKQHAGLIEVETKPGTFTEFKIILPRGAASIAKTGGRA